MAEQALKIDSSLKAKTPKTRGKLGRQLTIDMIKPDSKGAPVAQYLFPYFQSSGISNEVLANEIGFKNHSNMSMVRTGAARLPVVKAPMLAKILQLPNRYEFGMLVAENNMPNEIEALKRMGIAIDKKERKLLDLIQENVPKGDMNAFIKTLANKFESGEL